MPFLNSCDSGGLQQLINWAKLWAIVHDITDADGAPNAGAITRFAAGDAFGFGTTGDEEGDAAIDAARVLDNLRKAEDAADQGWKELYKGSNIKEYVLPHYNQAIGLRPDDWSYRNERGIAYLEDINNPDNAKLAKADFDKAAALAKKSGKPVEYLRMLKEREQAMARLVQHSKEQSAYPTGDTYNEQSRTYDELYKLTNDNTYLLLKQQADTNIKEGYYWQRDNTK
ncbi:MAG: hypothetical protein A2Y90_03600 [Chloroflexi bacterium RBG_13_52_12]|nr:MAG: hypothetical protein A2Y90_03600 [Chloroflexi bacterium RBG_13_52_12]